MTWQTREELTAWVADLPPADAVRIARLLADGQTATAVRTVADRIVFAATREATYAEVMAEFGLSRKQVMSAVERCHGTRGGLTSDDLRRRKRASP